MKAYLAGAIRSFDDISKAKVWREELTEALDYWGIAVYNPFLTYEKRGGNGTDFKSILDENTQEIYDCDVMFVNLENILSSYGTIYEMSIFYNLRKTIFAFGSSEVIEKIREIPHISGLITVLDSNLEESFESFSQIYIRCKQEEDMYEIL